MTEIEKIKGNLLKDKGSNRHILECECGAIYPDWFQLSDVIKILDELEPELCGRSAQKRGLKMLQRSWQSNRKTA